MADEIVVGRRRRRVAQITRPGDYCGPIKGYTGDVEACFFLLPNAPTAHVPRVRRPCRAARTAATGSLEIRASIGAAPFWHGFLDEGHKWRVA